MNGKALFSQCIQSYFEDYLEDQLACSYNTLDSYSVTFSLLNNFIGSARVNTMTISELTKDDIMNFLRYLKEQRKLSDCSCNIRLAHIKSFANYISRNAPSVMENCRQIKCIAQRKVEKKTPISISMEAVKAITHAPDMRTKKGLKHATILSLLYDSACRVEELINLQVKDVFISKNTKIHVLGKGRKHRTIAISEKTGKLLDYYMKIFNLYDQEKLVFESRTGGTMTRQGVNYIIKLYVTQVRESSPNLISDDISVHPHTMRHAKATHLVDSGCVSLKDVRDFLGHESELTTEVYLSSNPEHTRKAIEKASAEFEIPAKSSYSTKSKKDLEAYLKTKRL